MNYPALVLSLACTALSMSVANAEDAPPARTELKVCADPNYMPFSNQKGEGYENRIAQLIADELGLKVAYTWFPQRLGFIRNTLRKENPDGEGFLCDLVIGLPTGYELASTTKPYMQSRYVLVTVARGKLANLKKPEELMPLTQQDADIHIGTTERSPGAEWLARHQLFNQMVSYVAQSGDPNEYPGQVMLEDLLTGKLDGAIVWGPTAAYFMSQSPPEQDLTLHPFAAEPGVRFDYTISAGVRFGEKEWKAKIDEVLEKRKADIQKILQDYQIPLMDIAKESAS